MILHRERKVLLVLFLFIVLSLTHISSEATHLMNTEDRCPPLETLRKCSCEIKNGGIRVSCEGFVTDEEVKQHLDALKGYSIARLKISKFTAATVPTDIFNGLDIQELSLEDINVQDASFRKGKQHLQGLEDSLTSLEIRKSFRKDRDLLNFQLGHLKRLEVIILEDNRIPEVGNDWFADGPERLNVLIFERNFIEELGDKAFSALKNLKILAVAGNHLNSISRSMLPKEAHKLTTLDLAGNKIHVLPRDIFSGMPSLRDLNLDNNFLHKLEENTWSSIFSRLDALELLGNNLSCDDELKWICTTKMPATVNGKCGSPSKNLGLTLKTFCKQRDHARM